MELRAQTFDAFYAPKFCVFAHSAPKNSGNMPFFVGKSVQNMAAQTHNMAF